MGVAFERAGGELITVDIDPEMVRKAKEHLAAVDLDKTVEVREGDALKVLPELKGKFDFLFLDAVKQDYLKYFKIMEPKMKKGAVVVGHNVIQSERQMKDFLDYIQQNPDYDTVIIRASLEKGDGMSISYKIR